MSASTVSRRGFLVTGTGGMVWLGMAPRLGARVQGANDRLSIGMIGTGDRGQQHIAVIQRLAQEGKVTITALCDVWKVNLARASATVEAGFGQKPRRFARYGELLALEDVDAVVIATPDFAHTPILLAALEAGKDAYVEKPMALEVAAASRALDLARQRGRVVQVGTQYRSHGGYVAAARELATGVLGQISRVSASANFNEPRWARTLENCKAEDVDWDAFLLDCPRRPFDAKLLRRWHLYREFTNGLSGLWMSHYVDAVHQLTGASYPSRATALGGNYVWRDGREHTDTFHALIEYPEGFLFDWGMGLGNSAGVDFRVYGTKGTLEVSKNYVSPDTMVLSPVGGEQGTGVTERKIPAAPMAYPDPLQTHLANWFECIRTRARPNADIQYGHQHAVATIMAAAALQRGVRQRYDAERREIRADG